MGLGSGADMTAITEISTRTGGRVDQSLTGSDLSVKFTAVLYQMSNLVEVQFRSRLGEINSSDNTRELKLYLNYGTLSTSFVKTYGY